MSATEQLRDGPPGRPPSRGDLATVRVLDMAVARVSEGRLLDYMFAQLCDGRGGWLITANLDHLRRYARDIEVRELYARADVIVADGMPLVWAARVLGETLPERVAGSSLVYRFAERAVPEGRSIYLLGGAPGAAEEASRVLCQRYPGLRIAGCSAPMVHDHPQAGEIENILSALRAASPDLLLVGLGSPKQERLIAAITHEFPATWMVGVGISFSFVSGDVSRAPVWMQQNGLEWVHRLVQEPRRLATRYLVHDLPFAIELFARATVSRLGRR